MRKTLKVLNFGLSEAICIELMTFLARIIPQKLEEVFECEQDIPGVSDLRIHFERPVIDLCRVTLQALCAK